MAGPARVSVEVSDLLLEGVDGGVRLAALAGVQLVVLMRHRH